MRAQLRFFEQLDRLERQRKEEQEREILLKAAKVRKRRRRRRRPLPRAAQAGWRTFKGLNAGKVLKTAIPTLPPAVTLQAGGP